MTSRCFRARTAARATLAVVLTAIPAGSLVAQATAADSAPAAPAFRWVSIQPDTQVRPRAVTHSDLYYTRLTIHRIGSYAMLPLFAGEYLLGNRLLKDADNGVRSSQGIRGAHAAVAAGLGVLFGVNTATGLWNLWDTRHESQGGARKYIHAALLVAADAGIMLAAASADDAREQSGGPRRHRNIAVGAIGIATVGSVMMWLWQ